MDIKKSNEVSVIIPVFNAQDTLSYCLDSILDQTFQDFEIIIINDGSTDNSQKIIDNYKKKHPDKFKIYEQKNSGVAITRNRGIEYAQGDYLFFIDNDDYIENDYLETLLTEIKSSEKDMIIAGYKRINRLNGKEILNKRPSDKEYSKYMFLAPWAKIFRRESIRSKDIKFLNSPLGEDVYFSVIASLKLSYEITKYIGYNWVYNRNSVSNTKQKTLNSLHNVVPLFEEIEKQIKNIKLSKDERILLEYFYIKTAIYYILLSVRKSESNEVCKKSEEIFGWIESKYPKYQKNKYIGFFKPRGEVFSTRFIVTFFIFLQKIKMERTFLKIYSKI